MSQSERFEQRDRALAALVPAIRSGDEAAFERLIELSHGELRAFLAVRAADLEQVEDCLQGAYVEAFRGFDGYRGEGSVLSWLKGIAHNLLRQDLRRRRGTMAVERATLEDLVQQRLEQRLADEAAGTFAEEALQQRLQRCLTRLSPRARQILELHHVEGWELKRLAQRFRITAAAVANQLLRVRRSLRDCIERRPLVEEPS